MTTPTDHMRLIQLALGRIRHVRLFRNNVAMGWVGKSRRLPNSNDVIIGDARPLHAGLCEGSSDLIGWTTKTITPDMVGKPVAIFTAVEVKMGTGRASPEQLNFIKVVRESGGISGVVRSPEEAQKFITDHAK